MTPLHSLLGLLVSYDTTASLCQMHIVTTRSHDLTDIDLFDCRNTVTENAEVQPGEKLDCSPFDCSKKGYTNPMVEIKAGLNLWHQVRVHKETANELYISYPGMYSPRDKCLYWPNRSVSGCGRGARFEFERCVPCV